MKPGGWKAKRNKKSWAGAGNPGRFLLRGAALKRIRLGGGCGGGLKPEPVGRRPSALASALLDTNLGRPKLPLTQSLGEYKP